MKKFMTKWNYHFKGVCVMNYDREIWEGWTVRDFIEELEPQVNMIMSGNSWVEPFKNKKELAKWCRENQPYYKGEIKEVTSYFAKKYL